MEQEIVGYRFISGKSRKTGEPFRAYILSVISEDKQDGAVGRFADNVFVGEDTMIGAAAAAGMVVDERLLGSRCLLVYNKSGFIDTVRIEGKGK